ncbi:MAG: carboxypeptidase regulatory-like domain-containing protein [bacterium]
MWRKSVKVISLFAVAVLFISTKPDKYTVVSVENGASIRGVVTFSGTLPAPEKISIAKDTQSCGTGSREIQWIKLAADGTSLQNVAVYIAKIGEGKDWEKPKDGYLLNQENCRFFPAFLAVPNGENLRILNSDPILHNIHTYEIIGRARRTMFNVGQPEKDFEFSKPIKTRRGNTVKIECDAHVFMHAWIFVPENPYYALVDKKGEYTISDIPPGSYSVKAWHPTLGEKKSEVTLKPGQKLILNFEFTAK